MACHKELLQGVAEVEQGRTLCLRLPLHVPGGQTMSPLAVGPDRLLWGSDWPHTKPSGTRPSTAALVRLFQAWTPAAYLNRIGKVNALSFYRF